MKGKRNVAWKRKGKKKKTVNVRKVRKENVRIVNGRKRKRENIIQRIVFEVEAKTTIEFMEIGG